MPEWLNCLLNYTSRIRYWIPSIAMADFYPSTLPVGDFMERISSIHCAHFLRLECYGTVQTWICLFTQLGLAHGTKTCKNLVPMGSRLRATHIAETTTHHSSDVIMSTMASQITGVTIVYSTVCSGEDQRKHQSSASLAFVRKFTGDRWFPAQKATNAENVSIWWCHHYFICSKFYEIVYPNSCILF